MGPGQLKYFICVVYLKGTLSRLPLVSDLKTLKPINNKYLKRVKNSHNPRGHNPGPCTLSSDLSPLG